MTPDKSISVPEHHQVKIGSSRDADAPNKFHLLIKKQGQDWQFDTKDIQGGSGWKKTFNPSTKPYELGTIAVWRGGFFNWYPMQGSVIEDHGPLERWIRYNDDASDSDFDDLIVQFKLTVHPGFP